MHGLKDSVYYHINQQGTSKILAVCHSVGINILVFTSSTGVVWSGNPIVGRNEKQVKIPEIPTEAYNHTKALAEQMVLSSKPINMSTVANRWQAGGRRKRQKWAPYSSSKTMWYDRVSYRCGCRSVHLDVP